MKKTYFLLLVLSLLLQIGCGDDKSTNNNNNGLPTDGKWEGKLIPGYGAGYSNDIKFIVDSNGTRIMSIQVHMRLGGIYSIGGGWSIQDNSFEIDNLSQHTGIVIGKFKSSKKADGNYDLKEDGYYGSYLKGTWSAKWVSSSKSLQ